MNEETKQRMLDETRKNINEVLNWFEKLVDARVRALESDAVEDMIEYGAIREALVNHLVEDEAKSLG